MGKDSTEGLFSFFQSEHEGGYPPLSLIEEWEKRMVLFLQEGGGTEEVVEVLAGIDVYQLQQFDVLIEEMAKKPESVALFLNSMKGRVETFEGLSHGETRVESWDCNNTIRYIDTVISKIAKYPVHLEEVINFLLGLPSDIKGSFFGTYGNIQKIMMGLVEEEDNIELVIDFVQRFLGNEHYFKKVLAKVASRPEGHKTLWMFLNSLSRSSLIDYAVVIREIAKATNDHKEIFSFLASVTNEELVHYWQTLVELSREGRNGSMILPVLERLPEKDIGAVNLVLIDLFDEFSQDVMGLLEKAPIESILNWGFISVLIEAVKHDMYRDRIIQLLKRFPKDGLAARDETLALLIIDTDMAERIFDYLLMTDLPFEQGLIKTFEVLRTKMSLFSSRMYTFFLEKQFSAEVLVRFFWDTYLHLWHQGYDVYALVPKGEVDFVKNLLEKPRFATDQKEKIIKVLKVPEKGLRGNEERKDFYSRFGEVGVLQDYLPSWKQRVQEGLGQHSTHSFDLGRHTAVVLEKVQESAVFQSLAERDQELLLLVALYHDIAKKTGVIDADHEVKALMELDALAGQWGLNGPRYRKLLNIFRTKLKIDELCDGNYSDFDLFSKRHEFVFTAQQRDVFEMACALMEADSFSVSGNLQWWDRNRKEQVKSLKEKCEPLFKELESTWFPLINAADYLNQLPKEYVRTFDPQDGAPAVEIIMLPTTQLPDMLEHGVQNHSRFVAERDFSSLKERNILCSSFGFDRRFKKGFINVVLCVTGDVVVASPLDIGSQRQESWRYAFSDSDSPHASIRAKVARQVQNLVGEVLPEVPYEEFLQAARVWIETYDLLADRGELMIDSHGEVPGWLKTVEQQHAFRAVLSLVEKLVREYPLDDDNVAGNYFSEQELWEEVQFSRAHTSQSLARYIERSDGQPLPVPHYFEAHRSQDQQRGVSEDEYPNNEIILTNPRAVAVSADYPPHSMAIDMARSLGIPIIVAGLSNQK